MIQQFNYYTYVCFCLLVIIISLGTGCVPNNDLRRSAVDLRSDLLKETPLGSTISDIEVKLRDKGMRLQLSRNAGFLKQEKGNSVVVGTQSVRVHLGTYRSSIFSQTSVTAFWGFNDKSQLIDIWVWKTTDAP
jgi:hypothetical protein